MIRRFIASCSLTVAATLASAQSDRVDMVAYMNGKEAGTATLTRVFSPSGLTTKTALTLTQQGHTVTIDLVSTSNKWGVATQKVLTISQIGGKVTLTTTFGPKGATVVANTGQKRTVPMATKTTRSDITDLWFVKVQPKVGEKAVYQSFDPINGKWTDVRTTYVGKRTITINGQKVQAHMLQQTRDKAKATLYVDSRGMPLKTEEPKLTLIRRAG